MAASVTSVNLESTRSKRLSVRGSINEARRSAIFEGPSGGSGGRRFAPVTSQDSSDFGHSPINVVVHDHVVEAVGGGLLGGGPGETPLHDGGVLPAPREQPAALLVPRRRLHEDEHGIRERLLDGERALHVDLRS